MPFRAHSVARALADGAVPLAMLLAGGAAAQTIRRVPAPAPQEKAKRRRLSRGCIGRQRGDGRLRITRWAGDWRAMRDPARRDDPIDR